jgi:hypothetical protein
MTDTTQTQTAQTTPAERARWWWGATSGLPKVSALLADLEAAAGHVRALSDVSPIDRDSECCVYCEAQAHWSDDGLNLILEAHGPDCDYVAARRWLAAYDGEGSGR